MCCTLFIYSYGRVLWKFMYTVSDMTIYTKLHMHTHLTYTLLRFSSVDILYATLLGYTYVEYVK